MQHAEVQTQLLGIRVAQRREGREGHNLFKDRRLKTGFREEVLLNFFLIFIYLFIFGCAGSPLLHGFPPSCSKQGLLSSRGAWVSHCHHLEMPSFKGRGSSLTEG